jgi:diguanylate cyclase (GGDEF)-like protein/PAS domain S-box-containing protein
VTDEQSMPVCRTALPFGPPGAADQEVWSRLLDALPDAVIVIDGEGGLKWANHTAERLFGRSIKDSVGLSGLELVHPEDLEFVLLSLATVHGKEVGTPIEVRLATATGWRLVELIGVSIPWFSEGAVLIGLRDLTERRRYELAHSQDARFRSLVQNSAVVTMLLSPAGVVESVSGALTRMLGHDPELVEGRPLTEVVREDDRPALERTLVSASSGASASSPVTVTVGLLRSDGAEPVPFELTIVNLIDDPTVGGYVVSGHDVTDRVAAELELRDTLSLLQATLDATADGILVVDAEGKFTSFNRRFADMWRLSEAVLRAGDDATTVAFARQQLMSPELFVTRLEEISSDPDSEIYDVLRFHDGRVFERCSMPQRVDGEVVGRVWSFRDVTDRKQLEDRLSYQAFHDSLTGLGNRALFQDRLDHAVARSQRTGGQLAVLFLDLDNFKNVNDILGHQAGDTLLQSTAAILVQCLRKTDTAARLGGDEFGIIVEEITDHDDVTVLAERILEAIHEPLVIGSQGVEATVSIGITFGGPGLTSKALLCNADLAMYAAKDGGKNRYAEFKDGGPALAMTTA